MTISLAPIRSNDVRIYEYGARLDRDSVKLVDEQIRKGRELYNALIAEMQQVVRDMQAYVLDAAGDDARQIAARIEALNVQFDAARAENDEATMKVTAQERRGLWRDLAAALSSVRKERRTEINSRFYSRIGKNSSATTYQIRCQAVANGLGWATANAVLDNALQAWQKSIKIGRAPRFSVGAEKLQDSLTLQFTLAGGLPVAALLAGRHGECALRTPAQAGRRAYGEFAFRLGPAAAKQLATGTWQYHRPMPQEGRVGLVRLVRRRVGPVSRYVIQFMVRHSEPAALTAGRAPLAAVHFGWASDVSGRRIAAIADGADPGAARLVHLPPEIEEGLDRADEIQSARYTARDELVAALKRFDRDKVPGELRDDFVALMRLPAQHVAPRRLAWLCRRWRDLGGVPQVLDQWATADRMHFQAQTGNARRARLRRMDFYRNLAVDLARRYEAVVIEPLDLVAAAVKVSQETGERSEFTASARRGLVVAALYELETAVRQACAKNDTVVLDLAAPTATTCAICGGVVPHTKSQTLTCDHCGAIVDRKLNGAAIAYQLVEPELGDWLERYQLEQIDTARRNATEIAQRKVKMANARKARRTQEELPREPQAAQE